MHFKKHYEEIKKIAEQIYYHPELGYKEHQTKQTIIDYLKKLIKPSKLMNLVQQGSELH